MDLIDNLAYDLYVLTQISLQKQIWTSKKNFVEQRDIFYKYYMVYNILLRKDKIEKIKNRINGLNN